MNTAKIRDLPIKIIDGDRSSRYPKRDEFQNEGILFLNTTNIVDNHLDLSSANYISVEKFTQLGKGKLQRFDIVMTTRGSIGKVALFNHPAHQTGFINAQMLIFRPDATVIDPYFLYYLFCGSDFQGLLKNFASGSAQPQLPIVDLKEIEIPCPPLPTQRKIAAILSAYDDLIENNTRRIRILEAMAQAIYREWFVNFRYPGHEGVRLVESPLGPIPEGWEVKKLGDLVNCIRKSTEPGPHLEELRYIPIDLIPRKSLSIIESLPGDQAKSSLLMFDENDVLFGAMRPYFHKVSIAPFNGVTRSTCFVLRPIEPCYLAYSLMTLFQTSTIEFATNHSQGGTIPYVVWDNSMSEMPVINPPISVINPFEQILHPIIWTFKRHYFRQNNLRQQRDMLLPRLISGELNVEALEIPTL